MGRPITTTAVSRQYFISRGALVSIMEHRAGRRRRATTPAHFDHAGRGNDSTRKKLVPEACFCLNANKPWELDYGAGGRGCKGSIAK